MRTENIDMQPPRDVFTLLRTPDENDPFLGPLRPFDPSHAPAGEAHPDVSQLLARTDSIMSAISRLTLRHALEEPTSPFASN